jgi:hypothetical protein
MNQLRHRTPILSFLFVAALAALLAVPAQARHDDPRDLVRFAADLERAADDAGRLADRVNHRSGPEAAVTDGFYELADAARRYQQVARRGDSTGAFDAMVNRYWDLRADFRHYHGPDSVRRAFHRVNAPMEDLYYGYTGRDLYRDDPGVRGRQAHRPDRYDRAPDPRGPRGRGRHAVPRGRRH